MCKWWKEIKRRFIAINQEIDYSDAVNNYLFENRERFLDQFTDLCAKTNGRVPYDELKSILGREYPKAPWLNPKDDKEQIKAFFREINIIFRADDTHLYFP